MKYKLINNKQGVQFKLAFFAVVALSMVVISTGVIIEDWNTKYNSGLTYDLSDYSKLDEMSASAKGQKGNISVKSSAQDESNFEGTSIRAAFGIINTVYAPFKVVFGNGGMLDSVTERFGAPDYIRQGIVTMIFIAFTWAIVTILFGRLRT